MYTISYLKDVLQGVYFVYSEKILFDSVTNINKRYFWATFCSTKVKQDSVYKEQPF